ncbi:MAG: hypothetical protein Q7J27_07980 [Syntrophales bacterium]|nr:hypothetical protein [Syntrophales bacterium]
MPHHLDEVVRDFSWMVMSWDMRAWVREKGFYLIVSLWGSREDPDID